MAKLVTMFILIIVVQAVLTLYIGQDATTSQLWTFVTNPTNWNNLDFILGIIGIAGAMGLAGIAIGSQFGFKTDFIIFALAIAGLISIGVIFRDLYNVLNGDLASVFCSGNPNCAPATWITAIVIGPVAFYYVWTVLEWWRGKDI